RRELYSSFLGYGCWPRGSLNRSAAWRIQKRSSLLRETAVRSALLCVVGLAVALSASIACDPARPDYTSEIKRMTGGDPSTGQTKIRNYGCQSCHTIPGITGAEALVAPPLVHWSKRVYIAGE